MTQVNTSQWFHRKADERGKADFGWLQSAHSFSFGQYYDPRFPGFANLRVINDDRVAPDKGFGSHPHQDVEIFSYVLEGALEHKDSLGNGSTVTAGGVQYMSAGSGVVHSEFNPSSSEPVRFLQVWLLPNVTGESPRYETLDVSAADKDGQLALILSSKPQGNALSMKANADVYAATLNGDQAIEHSLAGGRKAWIQLARGSVEVNGMTLNEGDGLGVASSGTLLLNNGDNAEFLLFDLEAS